MRLSFLLKERRGAFDGAQAHDLPIASQTHYPLRHDASVIFKIK